MPRPQHTARSGGAAILPARSTGNLHNSRHKPRRAGKGDARAGTALHPGGTLGGTKLARSAARVTIVVFLSRACYELGRKSHRNADFTVSLVPSRSPFPAFLRRF